jgi:hypothetical protein
MAIEDDNKESGKVTETEQVVALRKGYELLSEYASQACSALGWGTLMPSGPAKDRFLKLHANISAVYLRIQAQLACAA